MATATELSENSRQGFEVQNAVCIGLEVWLSQNTPWGCGHVYDETPVGIAVYVRNDPVNIIDPDGRDPYAEFALLEMISAGIPANYAISFIEGTTRWDGGWYYFFPSAVEPVAWAVYVSSFGGFAGQLPLLPPPGGGGGGGGGVPSKGVSTTPAQLLAASTDRVQVDLKKPDCAKNFKNADIDSHLSIVAEFKMLDPFVYKTNPNSGNADWVSGPLGSWDNSHLQVYLNIQVNWVDPNKTPATLDGKAWNAPLLVGAANQIGITTKMTAAQFMDLTIVHELAHHDSLIGNPDDPLVERKLWDDCIK